MMTLDNFMDICKENFMLRLDFYCCDYEDIYVNDTVDNNKEEIRANYGTYEITDIEYNTDVNAILVTVPVITVDDDA